MGVYLFISYADQGKHLYHVIAGAATSLLNAEEKLNHFDHLVGDGDCGSTLKAGAQGTNSWPFNRLYDPLCHNPGHFIT